jgi:SAM-dependent methyltransferase
MSESEGKYRGTVAELYDLWFPPGQEFEDQGFYARRIAECGGMALEVACGTGRLLIPFLEAGLPVEGVDISTDMMDLCRAKAQEKGLRPTLYRQAMQELDLPRRYRMIYLPFCSFQYILDPAHALESLRRFYAHLEPGGRLYVSMYIPWEDMHARNEWKLKRIATRPSDGATVLMHEATVCDRLTQIQTDWYRYEVVKDGVPVRTELETMALRWYYRNEFELLLASVGFRDFDATGDYLDVPAEQSHDAMVFSARR